MLCSLRCGKHCGVQRLMTISYAVWSSSIKKWSLGLNLCSWSYHFWGEWNLISYWHLWDTCSLILCSHCLIWLHSYNLKTNKIISYTLLHVNILINDIFAFSGYQKIPRAFYMVQELPRLQRVSPYWELSQRASHWRHCNGNWLCVLQEIGLQLQSPTQELPAASMYRQDSTVQRGENTIRLWCDVFK